MNKDDVRKLRERSMRETRRVMHQLLINEQGHKRLLAISDEEWEAAIQASQEGEAGGEA